MLDKVPILAAASLGLGIFVAKMRFVLKVVQAKTDFNVFNYSLALRLIASGTEKTCSLNCNVLGWLEIFGRFWTHNLVASHCLPSFSWWWRRGKWMESMHQLIVTLDSIRNSCDVLYVSIIIQYHYSGWSSEGFSMRTAGHGDYSSIDYVFKP